ncbi:MAG: small basic protein [Planctomycetaceae bacterium]|jgi:small basic protein (TIGR04137 family)|nr:small basic protein [Planctomycetaceae bacterium]
MTIDKSLKISRGSLQNRNVLTRVERLEKLAEEERWNNGDSPFGLPKVRVAKVSLGRVKKVKDELDQELAAGTAEPEEE